MQFEKCAFILNSDSKDELQLSIDKMIKGKETEFVNANGDWINWTFLGIIDINSIDLSNLIIEVDSCLLESYSSYGLDQLNDSVLSSLKP